MKTNSFQTTDNTTAPQSSSNTYDWTHSYNAERGWECPRCGRINAPWVRQCDCSRNNWTITWTSDHPSWTGDRPDWWKEVTCGDNCPDNILNNSVTYKRDNPVSYMIKKD